MVPINSVLRNALNEKHCALQRLRRRGGAARIESLENRRLMSGAGLQAQYFTDMHLGHLGFTRIDPVVSFDWSAKGQSPGPSIAHTRFSARWTGQITAPATGAYTFFTTSDDGVRLWVNGRQLINDWIVHANGRDHATLRLIGNKSYNIRLEYFQRFGKAEIKLQWAGPQIPKEIIPTSQLSPVASVVSVPVPPAKAPKANSVVAASGTGAQGHPTSPPAQPLHVYSWSGAPGNVVPMAWALTQTDTPDDAAAALAPQLAARPAGDRVVFLWDILHGVFDQAPAGLIAKGPDVSRDQAWVARFFKLLKADGADVDRIVLDYEGGINYWNLFNSMPMDNSASHPRADLMSTIYNNPAAYANLPQNLKTLSPGDYGTIFGPGRDVVNEWNVYADSLVNAALRTAVLEPAQAALGHAVAISNFGSHAQTFPTTDLNGWPGDGQTLSGDSSPDAYLWKGQSYAGLTKDWRWNRLIDILNTIRSATAGGTGAVVPWLSQPGYRGDSTPFTNNYWLWGQMVRHMVADGVTKFIYWNPKDLGSPGDVYAANLFAQLSALPSQTPAQPLPPIPLDADQIVTGNVVTTYAQFLANSDMGP